MSKIISAIAKEAATQSTRSSAHADPIDVVTEAMQYRAGYGLHPSLSVECDDGRDYYYDYAERDWTCRQECGLRDDQGVDIEPPRYRLSGNEIIA